MPPDASTQDRSDQGYGRLRDGLDRAGKLPSGARVWWDRDYLPHVESSDLVQHVCFRLADSLPRSVVEQMEAELKTVPPILRNPEYEKRLNSYLDAGLGSCILRDPVIGGLIQDSLLHFHGERYTLHAWCVMPNHVHVLFQAHTGWTMSKIVSSWKSFTGRRISAYRSEYRLNEAGLEPGGPGSGRVWQREYFDRFMRDGGHFANTVNYIHRNPVKAGLVQKPEDWAFSSAYGPPSSTPTNHHRPYRTAQPLLSPIMTNQERLIQLAEDSFAAHEDPHQLFVTGDVLARLRRLHPATVAERAEVDGPVAWILLIPTTLALMEQFLAGTITEKELYERTPTKGLTLLSICAAP